MAEVTIQLRCDPQTGKKDIIVSLRSDKDALPSEHEQQHKAIVNKLLNEGIVKESELGRIIVEREEGSETAGPVGSNQPQQGEKMAEGG